MSATLAPPRPPLHASLRNGILVSARIFWRADDERWVGLKDPRTKRASFTPLWDAQGWRVRGAREGFQHGMWARRDVWRALTWHPALGKREADAYARQYF